MIRRSQGVVRANIGQKDLNKIPIIIPTKSEQEEISKILQTWDSAITISKQLISEKEKRFDWMLRKFLDPNYIAAKEWKKYKLGDLFDNRREVKNNHLPLISITRDKGVIPHSETKRKDSSNEDKSKYLRICPGDIGYNTMRMWQGVSAVSQIEGIVSPAYTICIPKELVDPDFMGFLFKTKPIIHKFYRYSQGLTSDTWNLKFHHFSEIEILIPNKGTQTKISNILKTANEEISVLKKITENYEEQKKGLIQKLITGEWLTINKHGETQ
jgi:type I restriction enzyme S subunit